MDLVDSMQIILMLKQAERTVNLVFSRAELRISTFLKQHSGF